VLRFNSTSGRLQIALRDGRWIPVEPNPESFFVNVGDSVQVQVPEREAQGDGRAGHGHAARLSMIYFAAAALSEMIALVPRLHVCLIDVCTSATHFLSST
jgi:gibberellin 2-oxidase